MTNANTSQDQAAVRGYAYPVSRQSDEAPMAITRLSGWIDMGEGVKLFDQVESLSNTHGAVLDPIVAIRRSVLLNADTSANIHMVSGMAETREAAIALSYCVCDRTLVVTQT